jgi:hypothetical protein
MQPGGHRHHLGRDGGSARDASGGAGVGDGAGVGSGGAAPKKLRVGAQHVPHAEAGGGGGGGGDAAAAAAAGQVAAGVAEFFSSMAVAEFFSSMAIDLDGIEVSHPVLSLRPWRRRNGGGRGGGGGMDGAGGGARFEEGDMLDINMRVRIRAFPPLNMQF